MGAKVCTQKISSSEKNVLLPHAIDFLRHWFRDSFPKSQELMLYSRKLAEVVCLLNTRRGHDSQGGYWQKTVDPTSVPVVLSEAGISNRLC